jgi:hypothetical protein
MSSVLSEEDKTSTASLGGPSTKVVSSVCRAITSAEKYATSMPTIVSGSRRKMQPTSPEWTSPRGSGRCSTQRSNP